MKATGVVRRIDDLGRIVIPKEIRKTLRIKNGEYLEFYLDKETIVLHKYSPMVGIPTFYSDYVYSIYSEIGGNVMISDREKIVAAQGNLKSSYIDKGISTLLDDIIQKREIKSSSLTDRIKILSDVELNGSYVIVPIISGDDAIGSVIIIFTDRNIDDFVISTATIAAKFLGKMLE